MSLASSTYSREHGRPAGMACETNPSRRMHRVTRALVVAGLLSLASLLTTLGMSVATAAPGLVWGSVSEVGPPASAPSGERMLLTDLSCPAAGDCVAIGTLEPKHELQALVVEETNGVWGKAAFVDVPEALEITYSQLESIDCSAVGDCTAVGYDETKAGVFQAIVASETGGSWGVAQVVQQPATSAHATLASVACTGPGSCIAVGESKNASTTKYEAVAVTEASGTWEAAVAVPQPADATPNGGLQSVSCPTAGVCAATGWYQSKTTGSYDAMGANDVDGTWTSEGIAIPNDNMEGLTGLYVSCSTSSSCGASGHYYEAFPISRAITASYADGKWSPSVQLIDSPSGNEYTYLSPPSCPASGSCAAVGGFYIPAEEESEPMVTSATGGVWGGAGGTVSLPSNALTEVEAKTRGTERYGELYSVSCWAVGACEAVGEYVPQAGEYAAMVASETGGVWGQAEEIASPSNADANNEAVAWLEGLSCTTSGLCGAVGSYKDNADEYRGMTASAGSALSVTSSSLPAGQVGIPYTAQLAAAGGFGPYTWSIASGSLPAGLNLNAATGAISGTPTGAGTSFTVNVANAGPPAQNAPRALSITINPVPLKPAKPAVTILSSKLKAAKHKLQVKLACRASTCNGVVKVVAVTKVRIRRKGKTVTEKRTVVLASGDYKIAGGKTQTIEVKLTATGRKLLAKLAKHHTLRVKLIVTVKGGATHSKTVKLS